MKEEQLLKLGFTKEIVSPYESGTEKGFHYFIYDTKSLCMITDASDEVEDLDFSVSFYADLNAKFTEYEHLASFLSLYKAALKE